MASILEEYEQSPSRFREMVDRNIIPSSPSDSHSTTRRRTPKAITSSRRAPASSTRRNPSPSSKRALTPSRRASSFTARNGPHHDDARGRVANSPMRMTSRSNLNPSSKNSSYRTPQVETPQLMAHLSSQTAQNLQALVDMLLELQGKELIQRMANR